MIKARLDSEKVGNEKENERKCLKIRLKYLKNQ